MLKISPEFGYWFSGFVDGEGCFQIKQIKTTYKGYDYYTYSTVFSINQRADNGEILLYIRDTLGFGHVCNYSNNYGSKKRPNLVQLQIQRKEHCKHLIVVFDTYPLRGKKKDDFELWKKAVSLRSTVVQGSRKTDWTKFIQLRKQLMESRAYEWGTENDRKGVLRSNAKD